MARKRLEQEAEEKARTFGTQLCRLVVVLPEICMGVVAVASGSQQAGSFDVCRLSFFHLKGESSLTWNELRERSFRSRHGLEMGLALMEHGVSRMTPVVPGRGRRCRSTHRPGAEGT